jgi:AraC family transcriptional regulator, exoenzyme S synthesis regulatory protein ExsA
MIKDRTKDNILFSCTGQARKDYEPFVEEHALSFILNGEMIINDGLTETKIKKGELGFILKNQLLKTQKIPQDNKPFMAISIFLPKETLYNYSKEHNIIPKGNYTGKPSFIFPYDSFLKGYFDSLIPYFENPEALTNNLVAIKTIEVIELLLKKTSMQNILFNFDEDFKIDLKAYMNKNYMHNIPLEKFATLTGRSISTFKRDFQTIFKDTPNKWLIKKRLDLAHFLISKKSQKPTDVYFDVGFVNFSHFSRIFKSEFGVNPSALQKNHG